MSHRTETVDKSHSTKRKMLDVKAKTEPAEEKSQSIRKVRSQNLVLLEFQDTDWLL